MGSFVVIPSAMVQASGLSALTFSELRLYWRLVGMLVKEDEPAPGDSDSTTIRVLAAELMEPEDKRERLVDRLDHLSDVKFKVNLDGRDGNEPWRMSLRLVTEFELRNEWVEIEIGRKMLKAIKERTTFARIKEAALFSMRGSKYSSILYTLIRDKMNQREKRWKMDIEYFREVMQVKEGTYDRFSSLKAKVIDPAIKEVNERTEFSLSWEKARTYKNEVKELAFTWTEKESSSTTSKPKSTRTKKPRAPDAPSAITEKATNYLVAAEFFERQRWAQKAVELGCPETPAMPAPDHVSQWASWVARPMADAGLISAD